MKYFKINNIKTYSALAIIAAVSFTSCLKKTGLNTDPDTGTGSNNVVEFQNTERQVSYTSVYPQYDNSLGLTGDTSGFFVNIDYAGAASTAPQDITVTLALNSTALTTFNTSSSTSYTVPDSSVYSFPKTAVIKKGSSLAQIRVTIKASSKYDYAASYALPLAITSSSYGVVSGNYNIAIFSFIVKNQYEGSYTSTGYLFHPSSPRAINATYSITTAGQYTCQFPFGDLGSSSYYFKADVPTAGGALVNYTPVGSTPTGANSGFMTADNPGGTSYASAPVAPGASPWLSSTYNNTYVVASKTFWIHAGYVSSSGAGQTTWTRQVYQKFVRQ